MAKNFFIFIFAFLPIIKFFIVPFHIIKSYFKCICVNSDKSDKKILLLESKRLPYYYQIMITSIILILNEFLLKPLSFNCEKESILRIINKFEKKIYL